MNRLGGSSLRLIITGGLPKNAVLQHCQYSLNQNTCLERQSCLSNATCGKLVQSRMCFYRLWDVVTDGSGTALCNLSNMPLYETKS